MRRTVAAQSLGRCIRPTSPGCPQSPAFVDPVVDHNGSLRRRERRGGPRSVRSRRSRNDQVAASSPDEGPRAGGTDHTRLGSQSDATSNRTDPVVEELAFFGLAILPVRGPGIDRRFSHRAGAQRGWVRTPGSWIERRFMWPAWSRPLDCAGIDALLDAWKPDRKTE